MNERAIEDYGDPPEGTSLRVYLFMLHQRKPVSSTEVRDGARLSTASLALYHLERLSRAGLVRRTPEGFLADKMVLKGFILARGHVLSSSLFVVAFFSTTLVLMLVVPWHRWTQLLVFSLSVNVVALVYSILRTYQSISWIRQKRKTKRVDSKNKEF